MDNQVAKHRVGPGKPRASILGGIIFPKSFVHESCVDTGGLGRGKGLKLVFFIIEK